MQKATQQNQQSQEQQLEVTDLALKQKNDTNTVIGRCRTMMAEIPELKQLMKQASENVETLKVLQQKAKNGTLLPNP